VLQYNLILKGMLLFFSYLIPQRRNYLVHDPLRINNTYFLMSRLQRVKIFIEDMDKTVKSYLTSAPFFTECDSKDK
jgi:hypothetical protein